MHSSENIFPSVQLLSVSDPHRHQELCHWTLETSMRSSISGWRNLSILLCFLCTPVQTVHQSACTPVVQEPWKYQTSVFIKQ